MTFLFAFTLMLIGNSHWFSPAKSRNSSDVHNQLSSNIKQSENHPFFDESVVYLRTNEISYLTMSSLGAVNMRCQPRNAASIYLQYASETTVNQWLQIYLMQLIGSDKYLWW